jgi:phosphate starvation-inducible PhoH-like protein
VRREDQPVLHVNFEDVSLLPLLFGEHDRNLARIEQSFDVRVTGHSSPLAIAGSQAEAAKQTFERLYGRLVADKRKTGQPSSLTPADIDAAIRFAGSRNESQPRGITTWRRPIEARSPRQAAYLDALDAHELVFGLGPAGTGKTYLAVAVAVAALKAGKVDRIILSRPAVEAGERLGFLPGDMKDKIDPYLRPLYDALYDMMPGDQVDRRLQAGEIEIAPLAFMRGRTLANSFIILDEAQNTTPTQMKMFLTRLGENSRMAVTGDPSQIDLPLGAKSGLNEAVDILRDVKGVTMVEFTDADVVRHPLVTRIVRAYNAHDPRLIAKPDGAKP